MSEQDGQGYHKKLVTQLDIKDDEIARGEHVAIKAQIVGMQGDSLATDFYWEGISVIPGMTTGEFKKKAPPKAGCCTIF